MTNNYRKQILLDQLAACHDDKSWIEPLQSVLVKLTAEQAAWKQSESAHSIRNLVNHLIFWNETWLRRFKGEEQFGDKEINNKDTFHGAQDDVDEAVWQAAVERMNAVYTAWRKAIADCEDCKLEAEIPNYFNAPWWGAISNLCVHNAYHIGQIVYIRKQQQLQDDLR